MIDDDVFVSLETSLTPDISAFEWDLICWNDHRLLYAQSTYYEFGFQRVWLKQTLNSKGWQFSCPLKFIGSLPESLTQGLLVGKFLVGGLGVVRLDASTWNRNRVIVYIFKFKEMFERLSLKSVAWVAETNLALRALGAVAQQPLDTGTRSLTLNKIIRVDWSFERVTFHFAATDLTGVAAVAPAGPVECVFFRTLFCAPWCGTCTEMARQT